MRVPSTALLLRLASAVSLLYCAGHMSGIPWTPGTGADADAVVRGMRRVGFEALGANRTYWDFYLGFGVIVGAFLAAQAVVLWALAAGARRGEHVVTPIAATLLVAMVVNAYLSHRYFFALPAVLAAVIAALLAAALAVAARR